MQNAIYPKPPLINKSQRLEFHKLLLASIAQIYIENLTYAFPGRD